MHKNQHGQPQPRESMITTAKAKKWFIFTDNFNIVFTQFTRELAACEARIHMMKL